MATIDDFTFRRCTQADLPAVVGLEAEVAETIGNHELLRRNSREMLSACLAEPHFAIGAWVGEVLAAFAILYVPESGDSEDLAPLLTVPTGLLSANFKLVVVKPSYRGNQLQVRLGRRLEAEAVRRGICQLCATVSPINLPSINNLLKLGFLPDREVVKYGYPRLIMVKPLR